MPNYRGYFLLSMPHIKDDFFHRSVVFIVEHTDDFVIGIIINQQNLPSYEALQNFYELGVSVNDTHKLHFIKGGPVRLQDYFILHEHIQKQEETYEIIPGIDLSVSLEIISKIINEHPEISHSIIDSYSVWDTEQLNDELKNNMWQPIPFDKKYLFSTQPKESLWNDLFSTLGVSLHSLSTQVGRD